MRRIISTILVILTVVGSGCPKAKPTVRIKMATTTSTENSGLLDVLLPAFKEKSNIEVSAIAVGTGKALKLGENGDVDLVLVHSPEDEKRFVEQGFGVNRRKVMYNDFVIVGPVNNPAQIEEDKPASEAFKKIAQTSAGPIGSGLRCRFAFISRGDESGTHKKEKELWQRAGITPKGRWYLETGQGMGATLMIANEKQGYCLVDRGTYIAYQSKIDLSILCQGDSNLLNPYGIIAVNPARHASVKYAEAMTFIEWLISSEAQKIIGEFSKNGQVFFHPCAYKE